MLNSSRQRTLKAKAGARGAVFESASGAARQMGAPGGGAGGRMQISSYSRAVAVGAVALLVMYTAAMVYLQSGGPPTFLGMMLGWSDVAAGAARAQEKQLHEFASSAAAAGGDRGRGAGAPVAGGAVVASDAASTCRQKLFEPGAVEDVEMHGDVVLSRKLDQPSAMRDCAELCLEMRSDPSTAEDRRCNVWVYCDGSGSPSCGTRARGECWMKRVKVAFGEDTLTPIPHQLGWRSGTCLSQQEEMTVQKNANAVAEERRKRLEDPANYRVFLDVEIQKEFVGRIEMVLYTSVSPKGACARNLRARATQLGRPSTGHRPTGGC